MFHLHFHYIIFVSQFEISTFFGKTYVSSVFFTFSSNLLELLLHSLIKSSRAPFPIRAPLPDVMLNKVFSFTTSEEEFVSVMVRISVSKCSPYFFILFGFRSLDTSFLVKVSSSRRCDVILNLI